MERVKEVSLINCKSGTVLCYGRPARTQQLVTSNTNSSLYIHTSLWLNLVQYTHKHLQTLIIPPNSQTTPKLVLLWHHLFLNSTTISHFPVRFLRSFTVLLHVLISQLYPTTSATVTVPLTHLLSKNPHFCPKFLGFLTFLCRSTTTTTREGV